MFNFSTFRQFQFVNMLNKNSKSKIFVLDTNVILHDHTCIYQFQDNDVILPITVLEELDKFKRGNDLINFQAREFTRLLDEIVGDELFNGGKQLGSGKGKLRIETGKPFSDTLKASFREDIPDHRILSIAEYTANTYKDRKTVLISKDINLRMKAKSLGIRADKFIAEDLGHGFFNRSPWLERTVIAADKFLASLGYLEGEPIIEEPEIEKSERKQD